MPESQERETMNETVDGERPAIYFAGKFPQARDVIHLQLPGVAIPR